MKKFFKEHMGSLIVIAAGLTIIALAKNYGADGGVFDKNLQTMFSQSISYVIDNNAEEE